MKTLNYYLRRPREMAIRTLSRFGGWLPDSLYLKCMFRLKMGYRLNLKRPKTFCEKIQWLKLYDRRPEYITMVDKYAVKDYVAAILGKEYIIPTLGVWDKVEDIDWAGLPDRFVLKCTHDSGGLVICKDKSKLDISAAKAKLSNSLSTNYYLKGREWPYKEVPRRIIAEEYIDPAPNVKDLSDYKWYCFGGEPKFCQVIQNRSTEEKIDLFDTEWRHQNFIGLNTKALNASIFPEKPKHLEQHLKIVKKLSENIPFSRIDLYETGSQTYFGEVTLYPASGMGSFRPDDYNGVLGHLIKLPGEKQGRVIIRLLQDDGMIFDAPDLRDYKFFCFNGRVKCFKIDFNRQFDHHANYFDYDGNLLPFGEKDFLPKPDKYLELPSTLHRMIEQAEKLSKGISFVRVDFYDHNGTVYFGEITFFPAGGMGAFEPKEWDYTLGNWINLPEKRG